MVTYKNFSDLPSPTPYFWTPFLAPAAPRKAVKNTKSPRALFPFAGPLYGYLHGKKFFSDFQKISIFS